MSWEKRGKSDYYYRKYRIGNRVVSAYIGKGYEANLVADEDDTLRSIKKNVIQRNKQEKDFEKKMDRKLDSMESEIASVVNSLLLISGYRTHKGQWRKRHERDRNE